MVPDFVLSAVAVPTASVDNLWRACFRVSTSLSCLSSLGSCIAYSHDIFCQVIIITNSDEGWVKYSCERFVPSLLHIIESYKIVSARTGYEKYYPGQPLCWKAAAFAHEVNEHYESSSQGSVDSDDMNTSMGSYEGSVDSLDSVSSMKFEGQREILSFGDSMEERTSVRIVAEQLGAVPKSVMFVQAPSPIQIIGQLQLLTQHMKFVCEHKGKLDLEISAEQAQRFADAYIRRTKPVIDEGFVKSLSNMLIPTDAYKKQQER